MNKLHDSVKRKAKKMGHLSLIMKFDETLITNKIS